MSNAPQGPGWWQAGDGNWYPPQQPPPGGGYGPPPAPAKKPTNVWLIVGVVAGCFLFLPCAGGIAYVAIGGGTTTTTAARGPSASSPATSGGGGAGVTSTSTGSGGGGKATKAEPAPLGTEIMAAKDWFVTVTAAELDADATMLALNSFNKPSPGEQYVLVTVKVANKGDVPADILSNIKLSLITGGGQPVTTLSCVAQVPDRLAMSTVLKPGETATGRLCFEMKAQETNGALMLAEPLFTLDTVADQRYLALQ